MKISKIRALSLAFLCMTATGAGALTASPQGQNQHVEWETVQSWPTGSKTLDMVHSLDGKYIFILNDKQQVQVFNRQGQLQGSIPVTRGVNTIDIAPQGEMLYLIDSEKNTFTAVAISFIVNIDTVDSPFEGPANAPVTIAVFTDFE
jgi:DNA-binding beta-propeller fold protein YncE